MTSIIVNDVLCYISTSRNDLTNDVIKNNVCSFYNCEEILDAKILLFNAVNSTPISRKGEKKENRNVQDILDLFVQCENEGKSLPQYCASRYNSMPATNDERYLQKMSYITDIILNLQREFDDFKKSKDLPCNCNSLIASLKNDIISSSNCKKICTLEKTTQTVSDLISSTDSPSLLENKTTNANRTKQEVKAKDSDVSKNSKSTKMDGNIRPSDEEVVINRERKTYSQALNIDNETETLSSSLHNDSSSWHLVTNRKQRKVRPKITGNKTENFKIGLSAAPRYFDVFIGGLNQDTSENLLTQYCKQDVDVDVVNCIALKSKLLHRKCFKVTINYEDKNKMFQENVWPALINVREFEHRKGFKRTAMNGN